MKNIHMLPTDKPSRGLVVFKESYRLEKGLMNYPKELYPGAQGYNIYITNNEKIKEGDWFLNTLNNKLKKCDDLIYEKNVNLSSWCKKIILTTDQDLIKDGVQSIDDEFLEWFVKDPSCEEVIVDKEQYHQFVGNTKLPLKPNYKIIIPKEEPCDNCNNEVCCCIIRKQETLEEVAERLTKDFPHYSVMGNMDDSDIKGWFLEALQKGAKWQQERMYSEEEVKEILFHRETHYMKTAHHLHINEWFEQFKKKRDGENT